MTELTIATWNLCARAGDAAARLGSLLADKGGADLVLLQESSQSGLKAFCEAAELDWGVHARGEFFDLLKVRGRAGGRRLGDDEKLPTGRCVAIAGRGVPLRSPCAFPDVPLPEKVMAGWGDLAGHRVTALNYHAPAGVTHGVKKPQQAVRIAEWLDSLDGPVVMAGDFNTPAIDRADEVKTHYFTGHPELEGEPGDDVLVGKNPIHGLSDALRLHLAANPNEMDRVLADRPSGPLEVSYRTGDDDGDRYRYDSIWLSPHFTVNSIDYFYEEAIEAGTDHALVLANVTLPEVKS